MAVETSQSWQRHGCNEAFTGYADILPDNNGRRVGLAEEVSMSEAEHKQQPENDDPGRPAWQGRATDELEYIQTETDYISSIVRSRGGLLSSDDLERVITLTRVLERVNKRLMRDRL
jgi:hypothetical protein